MIEYLSTEWFTEAAAALATITIAPETSLVIEYRVLDADHEVVYHITFGPAGVALSPTAVVSPDVRFTVPRSTAIDIAAGRASAQRAFIDGDLRLGGDSATLVRHGDYLALIDDALAELRARTQLD